MKIFSVKNKTLTLFYRTGKRETINNTIQVKVSKALFYLKFVALSAVLTVGVLLSGKSKNTDATENSVKINQVDPELVRNASNKL